MRKIIFIFSILLSSLCASLAQGQTYTVTWKVKGKTLTDLPPNSTQVKSGKKAKLPPRPTDACEKSFVGWTIYENYEAIDAPSDLFIDLTQSPQIYSNVTFHAVFADGVTGSFFDYTTSCCTEILFVEGIVSLDDAKEGKALFIKNPDPTGKTFENLVIKDENSNTNWKHNSPSVEWKNGEWLFQVEKPGYYMVEVYRAADDTYCEVNKYVEFNVVDSCTIEYVGFDDDWCATIAPASQGGRHKFGDSFVIPQERPADPEGLGRSLIHWNTSKYLRKSGETYQLGDTIIIKEDISLYPQWRWDIKDDTEAPYYELPNTDIVIFPGKTLSITDYYEANTIMLKGGLDESKTSYAMPSLYIEEGGVFYKYNPDSIVHFDLSINKDNYYPFAVPFPVLVSDIDYADPALAAASTYGTHYVIKRYDGALRAENGANRDQNWVQMNESETLQPGIGYIIIAMPVDGKAVIRIPLEFSDDWTYDGEQSDIGEGLNREEISISAHSGAAATAAPIHAGWNFIANPYLAKYDGNNITYHDDTIKYANIPRYDFSAYDQVLLDTATLSPEYPFFVQVGSDVTLNFATTGRRQAPAAVRANSSNQTVSATFHLVQTDNQTLDHTSIILNEQHTPAYEINADLEKMFGSAYTTSLYSISQDYRLAFNALSFTDAQSPIPFGFRAAEARDYTIVLTNPEDMAGMESVLLYDNHTHQTTNLLYFDYTFHTERTQDDTRFTIQFISRNNTTTNIEDLRIYPTSTTKFIHNNQLYITREGKIYNATGTQIK